jgi:hypothetical protein
MENVEFEETSTPDVLIRKRSIEEENVTTMRKKKRTPIYIGLSTVAMVIAIYLVLRVMYPNIFAVNIAPTSPPPPEHQSSLP